MWTSNRLHLLWQVGLAALALWAYEAGDTAGVVLVVGAYLHSEIVYQDAEEG